jgi:hypothetical protein
MEIRQVGFWTTLIGDSNHEFDLSAGLACRAGEEMDRVS